VMNLIQLFFYTRARTHTHTHTHTKIWDYNYLRRTTLLRDRLKTNMKLNYFLYIVYNLVAFDLKMMKQI